MWGAIYIYKKNGDKVVLPSFWRENIGCISSPAPRQIPYLAHNAKQRAEGLSEIWSWWGPLLCWLPWSDTCFWSILWKVIVMVQNLTECRYFLYNWCVYNQTWCVDILLLIIRLSASKVGLYSTLKITVTCSISTGLSCQKAKNLVSHGWTFCIQTLYWAGQWSWLAWVNTLCNLLHKKLWEVAALLLGILSRLCFTLCMTVKVEPRITKQYKCHHCCSCKNYQGKGMGGQKVSASFFGWSDHEFVEKMRLGASYCTSYKQKGMGGQEVSASFFGWSDHEFVEKMHLGASYCTSYKQCL